MQASKRRTAIMINGVNVGQCGSKVLMRTINIKKWLLYCPQGSGMLRQQLLMMHGITWYCMVLHSIAWYCMVLHGIAWYCMVLHGIAWYCIVLHDIAWYCM